MSDSVLDENLIDRLSPEDARELMQQASKLKKTLKSLSKNQLVALVIQQVNIAVEQQNINKILLEKLNPPKTETKND